jgi:hypothetical protein
MGQHVGLAKPITGDCDAGGSEGFAFPLRAQLLLLGRKTLSRLRVTKVSSLGGNAGGDGGADGSRRLRSGRPEAVE